MEIDSPPPILGMVPTSVYELGYARSYGVRMCQDNGLPEVSFTMITAHQFTRQFRVSAEGFIETDMDVSLEGEQMEVKRTHGH